LWGKKLMQLGLCPYFLMWGKKLMQLGLCPYFLISVDALHGPAQRAALAQIYVLVGEHEAALDEIEYLLSIPSAISVAEFQLDPTWDPLRQHPRYQRLVDEYSG